MDGLAGFLGHMMVLTSQDGVPSDILRTYFSPKFSVICIIFTSVYSARKCAEDIITRFLIFALVREKFETLQKRVRRTAVVNTAKFPTHCM